MLPIAPSDVARILRRRLPADEPRLFAAWNVVLTGQGECLVDRWPSPRAFLAVCGSNQALIGDPDDLDPEELHAVLDGFVEAPDTLAPVLRSVQGVIEWPRVNLIQPMPTTIERRTKVRRLTAADAHHLEQLSPVSSWISNTWGGPEGLAASRMAYGAFVGKRLASVACSFFVGTRFEDIGVVTEPEFRGRGLSPACVAALCYAIRRRRRVPSWTTSPDNTQSLRVAEKLGFTPHHAGRQWVVGRQVPTPAELPLPT